MTKKIKVLCFLDFFYPAFKAGGPIKTIYSMVKKLNNEIDFSIVTRDHDLNCNESFKKFKSNEWNSVEGVKVYYMSDANLKTLDLFKLIKKTQHDIIYFNSFFSFQFTGHLLILIKLFNIRSKLILAPRGEFSSGALSIKSFKKYLYIFLFKLFKLNKNIIWQASSNFEKKDILNLKISDDDNVYIAPNITNIKTRKDYFKSENIFEKYLNLVFIARISKVKNLTFLLNLLLKINKKITLDIYGPIEDQIYWKSCLKIIQKLPNNIKVNYNGELDSSMVLDTFKKYDLFVFPTLGENFGHVIIESLAVGTCVLTSTFTPWENSSSIKTIHLNNISEWIIEINNWVNFTKNQLTEKRKEAITFAKSYFDNDINYKKNIELFNQALLK